MVKRGEFYLSTDFIQYRNEELEEMDKNRNLFIVYDLKRIEVIL